MNNRKVPIEDSMISFVFSGIAGFIAHAAAAKALVTNPLSVVQGRLQQSSQSLHVNLYSLLKTIAM
jgi:hypothetical protein